VTGVILTSSTCCCVILYDLLTLVHYCLIVTGSFIYKNKHIRHSRSYLQETLAKMSNSPQHHSFLFVLAVNRVRAHRRTRVRPARSRPARRAAIRRRCDTTRPGYVDHLGTEAPRKPRRAPKTPRPRTMSGHWKIIIIARSLIDIYIYIQHIYFFI